MSDVHGSCGARRLLIECDSATGLIFGDGLLSSTGTYPYGVRDSVKSESGLELCTGYAHRKQRKVISSVFSPANLRDLVPLFRSVAFEASTCIGNSLMGT